MCSFTLSRVGAPAAPTWHLRRFWRRMVGPLGRQWPACRRQEFILLEFHFQMDTFSCQVRDISCQLQSIQLMIHHYRGPGWQHLCDRSVDLWPRSWPVDPCGPARHTPRLPRHEPRAQGDCRLLRLTWLCTYLWFDFISGFYFSKFLIPPIGSKYFHTLYEF